MSRRMDETENHKLSNPNRKKSSHGSSGSNAYEVSYLISYSDFFSALKKFCSLRQWAQVCIDGTVCLQLHQLAARLELVAIFIGGSEAIWVLRVLQFWNLLEVYCLIWIMKKPTRLKKSCLENLLWVISTQEYLQTCTMEWWPFRDFGKSTCEGVV